MPLPLAMPVIRMGASPIHAVRVAALGNVSVVMMPRAAAGQASSRRPSCRAGSAATSLSCGITSPITPVEATKTCFGGQPTSLAAAAAVAAQVSRPALPVKTLALPAFTTTARALPPASEARHQSTGAPGHLLEVNTPATDVPGASFQHHEVGASLIADAGRDGAEADASDRQQLRQWNGKRRDVDGHGRFPGTTELWFLGRRRRFGSICRADL